MNCSFYYKVCITPTHVEVSQTNTSTRLAHAATVTAARASISNRHFHRPFCCLTSTTTPRMIRAAR